MELSSASYIQGKFSSLVVCTAYITEARILQVEHATKPSTHNKTVVVAEVQVPTQSMFTRNGFLWRHSLSLRNNVMVWSATERNCTPKIISNRILQPRFPNDTYDKNTSTLMWAHSLQSFNIRVHLFKPLKDYREHTVCNTSPSKYAILSSLYLQVILSVGLFRSVIMKLDT